MEQLIFTVKSLDENKYYQHDIGIQDFAFDLVKSDENKLYVMQLKGVYLTKKIAFKNGLNPKNEG